MNFQDELFETLIATVAQLGWTIAIPDTGDDNSPVSGLIIGTPEYVDSVVIHLPDKMSEWEHDV